MNDNELTPIANVAFNGAVADEINRLMRTQKNIVEYGDLLAAKVRDTIACQCRREWVCPKCQLLARWAEVRNG